MREKLRENFKLGYYVSHGVLIFLLVAFGLSLLNNWAAGVGLSHIVVEVDGKYYERGRGGGPGGARGQLASRNGPRSSAEVPDPKRDALSCWTKRLYCNRNHCTILHLHYSAEVEEDRRGR
jgi:hypothetical protein